MKRMESLPNASRGPSTSSTLDHGGESSIVSRRRSLTPAKAERIARRLCDAEGSFAAEAAPVMCHVRPVCASLICKVADGAPCSLEDRSAAYGRFATSAASTDVDGSWEQCTATRSYPRGMDRAEIGGGASSVARRSVSNHLGPSQRERVHPRHHVHRSHECTGASAHGWGSLHDESRTSRGYD